MSHGNYSSQTRPDDDLLVEVSDRCRRSSNIIGLEQHVIKFRSSPAATPLNPRGVKEEIGQSQPLRFLIWVIISIGVLAIFGIGAKNIGIF